MDLFVSTITFIQKRLLSPLFLHDLNPCVHMSPGNLDRAEECRPSLGPGSREFNVWTAPDCAGLPCESGCRSWFYFSVSVPPNSTGLTLRQDVCARASFPHCGSITIDFPS